MSRFLAFFAVLLFASSTLVCAQVIHPEGPTFIITASNGGLSPSSIDVKVNQPVTLKLVADSGIHGIQSPDLGIPPTPISPGKLQTVTFRPKKAGTYTLQCMVMAGANHADMHLTVNVH